MRIRFLTVLFVLLLGLQSQAQEHRIQENGETYLIHEVQKGETIFSLSENYEVDRKELLNANPDLIFGLKAGQALKVPVSEAVHSTKEAEAPITQEELPSFHTYKVKRRDGLHFIAQRYNVTIDDILRYNPQLEKKGLEKGMTLLIPDANDLQRIREVLKERRQALGQQDESMPRTHTVVGDETLYSISKKYNRSISSIIEANPEVKNGLPIGMVLTIPEQDGSFGAPMIGKDGFFTHLVESGETFWSLERKYNVSRDVLEKYNPALENGLLAGLHIKIPVSEELPDIQVEPVDEDDFNKHEVTRGETLYSLADQYHVKISSIKKVNPMLNYRGLMAGETILIPKTNVEGQEVIIEEDNQKIVQELEEERMPELGREPLEHKVQFITIDKPESCQQGNVNAYEKYHVGLLLPLYLAANDKVNRIRMTKEEMLSDEDFMSHIEDPKQLPDDTFKIRDEKIIYPRSENFIHFYEGVLLAVDSLQKAGMNIELHVFDTNQEQSVVDSLVRLDVFNKLDLIIGPVFPNLQGPVAEFAYRNRIPMVSPLSSSGNFENNNPWYYKVNPTKEYLVRQTADFIGEEYFNKNLIVLEMGEYKHLPEATLVDLCREKFFSTGYLNVDQDVLFHEYDFSKEGYWGLRRILSKKKENVFIIPSETEAQVSVAVSNINSLSEDFPVTLVGMSNFQRYRSIQPEYFHHTNLHLLSPFFVNYHSTMTNRFIRNFRTNFSSEPNQFSFQGYDVAFYFMSALFQYGKDFTDCLPYHHVELNQGQFYFDKVSRFGGYMNRGLFVLKYKQNYDIVVDHLEGIPGLLLTGE